MIYSDSDLRKRCVELVNGGPIPVLGKGDKRFGEAFEAYMKVDTNSRVTSDIENLDLEIKTKVNMATDLTLFTTRPAYLRTSSAEFFRVYSRKENNNELLYSDVSKDINSFGFQLAISKNADDTELIIYDAIRNINCASINFGHIKHIAKMKMRNLLVAYGDKKKIDRVPHVEFHTVCIYENLFLTNNKLQDMFLNGKIVCSFRQSKREGEFKDHGTAFRLTDPKYLEELYSSHEFITKNGTP